MQQIRNHKATYMKKNQSQFRKWLYENGYTITSFCNSMGMKRTHINLVMTGKRFPGPALMMRIKNITSGKISKLEHLRDV